MPDSISNQFLMQPYLSTMKLVKITLYLIKNLNKMIYRSLAKELKWNLAYMLTNIVSELFNEFLIRLRERHKHHIINIYYFYAF